MSTNTFKSGIVTTDTTNGIGAGHALVSSGGAGSGSVVATTDIALVGVAGNTKTLSIVPATSLGQNTTVTIPDPGAVAATVVLSSAGGVTMPVGHTTEPLVAGLTASTTHTIAGGTPLTADICVFSTVANANDAATLPTAVVGLVITVINNGANTMNVYPDVSGGTINGGSTGASVTVATNAVTIFYCTASGTSSKWVTK